MARRDAQLVISAKDRASKIVDQITAAINDLVEGNSDLQASAKKTDSTLGKLGGAINKLDKAVDALSFGDRITKELAGADAAIDRLSGGITRTQGELADMRAGVEQASTSITNLTGRIERAQAVLAKQSAAIAEAAADAAKLAKAQTEAARAQKAFTDRAQELPAAIEAQTAKVAKAEARYDALQKKLADTEKPTQRLKDQVAAAGRAFDKQQASLADLTAEYAQIGPKVDAASRALAELAQKSAAATASVERQEQSIARTKALISGLAAEQRKAAGAQRNLTDEIARAEGSLAGQIEDLQQARLAHEQLQAAMAATAAEQARLRAIGNTGMEKQIEELAFAAADTRAELAQLVATAERMRAEIGQLGVPTRQMSLALSNVEQAADEAALKLMLQEEALGELGRAYKGGAQDIAALQRAQASFIATQARLSASLGEIASDGYEARQAIRALHAEADRSAQSWADVDRAIRSSGRGMKAAADDADGLTRAYRRMHGAKRETLSLAQRLRGEVLSMIAAYGGLYGVVSVLQQTTQAYQTLEAAQARLNVATEGNGQQTADELDFVRRTANRLGIEFGVLANEYSKFSLATQGTNLAGQRTRDIFVAVAEAARVSRTSNDQLAATFVALSQIASKGSVQMEELRQQLGDRLPGAINLMADALGVSTGELIKMMEQGQVTSDALLPFADELRERFGPELGNALAGTSVALGRLQNAAFQALVAFGEGGFIRGLTDLSNKLAQLLNSSDFRAFAQNVSGALGVIMDVLGVLADNFQTVAVVGGALFGLMAIRWAPAILRLVGSITGLTAALGSVRAGAAAANAAIASTGAAATTATGRIRALTVAVRAFLASTGVGLAIAAIGAGLAYWVTEADNATEALDRHQAILDQVKNGYDAVNGSVEEWREHVRDIGEQEAVNNLARMRQAVLDLEAALAFASEGNDSFLTNFFGYNLSSGTEIFDVPEGTQNAVKAVVEEFRAGTIEADAFWQRINEVLRSVDDGSAEFRQYSDNLLSVARSLMAAKVGADEAELIITALTGTTEEAEAALAELANTGEEAAGEIEPLRESTEDAAKAMEAAAANAEQFEDAIRGILGEIPELTAYMEQLEDQEAFNKMIGEAVEAAVKIADVKQAWQEMTAAFEGTSWTGLFTELFTDIDALIGRLSQVQGGIAGIGQRLVDAASTAVGGFGNMLSAAGASFNGNMADSLRSAGFTDEYVRAALAVIQNESGGNWRASESHNYSPGRAREFHSELRGMSDAEIQALIARGAEAFFEHVYGAGAASPAAGNSQPGDGYRFRGRGPIQLTGRANYERYAAATGHDIVNNPDLLLTDMKVAMDVVAAYLIDRVQQTGNALNDVSVAVRGNTASVGINAARDQAAFDAITTIPTAATDGTAPAAMEIAEQREAIRQEISDNEFRIAQQRRINEGQGELAAILEAQRELLQQFPLATDADLERVGEQARQEYAIAQAQERQTEMQREQTRLDEERAAARAETQDTLSDAEFEVEQQNLKNQGLERQAAIEQAIRDARKADENITEEEIAQLARLAGARYDAERAGRGESDELDRAEKAQERVNELLARRNALEEQYELLKERGNTSGAAEVQGEIAALNTELLSAIANAKAMWEAVGGAEAATAVATLDAAAIAADGFDQAAQRNYLDWSSLADLFVNGLAGAIDTIAQGWEDAEDKTKLVRDAFLQFAGDFLLRIAQMILQQAIFNMLNAALGGTRIGTAIGLPAVGTGHSGGIVGSQRIGSGNGVRHLSPAVFETAQRFHGGGIVGLAPNEVPAVLKKGENVQTEDDPFHPANRQTTVKGGDMKAKIVNVIDGSTMLEAALKTSVGEKLMLNFIRDNAEALGLA